MASTAPVRGSIVVVAVYLGVIINVNTRPSSSTITVAPKISQRRRLSMAR